MKMFSLLVVGMSCAVLGGMAVWSARHLIEDGRARREFARLVPGYRPPGLKRPTVIHPRSGELSPGAKMAARDLPEPEPEPAGAGSRRRGGAHAAPGYRRQAIAAPGSRPAGERAAAAAAPSVTAWTAPGAPESLRQPEAWLAASTEVFQARSGVLGDADRMLGRPLPRSAFDGASRDWRDLLARAREMLPENSAAPA